MGWWSIENLRTGYEYEADTCPLNLVDCVTEVSIPLGHTLMHNEVIVRCGPVEVDMRTGAIWLEGKVAKVVDKPDKLILFRRKARDGRSGAPLLEVTFVGVVSKDGEGFVLRGINDTWELKPYNIGVPVSD